jgi:hypothetical protein
MGSINTDIQYRTFIDEVSPTVIYVGYSEEGVPEDEYSWIIYKIETVGTVIKQLTVDGKLLPKSRWDLRATYTYS